jgi:transcriptional regulator with XRE-family HTH domain
LDPLKFLGENIKRQITAKGYPTVEVFAHEHAIAKGTLSKILNGKVDAKVSTLIRIAKALDMGLAELMPQQVPEAWVMERPKQGYQVRKKKPRS